MKPKIFKVLFSLIGGISFAAALVILAGAIRVYVPDWQKIGWAAVVVVFPLLVESFGAIGLVGNWFFRHRMRPGKVVNFLQWIAGIFGIAAIFDLVMRITRKSAWMVSGTEAFAVDAIFIVLFALWLVVSHYINKDVKERKVCQFC